MQVPTPQSDQARASEPCRRRCGPRDLLQPSRRCIEIGDEAWQRGLTVNMSDSGVLLEVAAPLTVESLLEMTFYLPERLGRFPAGQLNCVGRVVRRAPPTPSVPHAVAARFVEFRCARGEGRAARRRKRRGAQVDPIHTCGSSPGRFDRQGGSPVRGTVLDPRPDLVRGAEGACPLTDPLIPISTSPRSRRGAPVECSSVDGTDQLTG